MKVLAIEASCPPGSIALVYENQVIDCQKLQDTRRTTASFAVVIQRLLSATKWHPRELDLIATCHGPGSFTGIRIGVTAAKVLAYAVDARAIGINTLELIAYQTGVEGEIEVVLDAQRGDLFAARYLRKQETLRELTPARLLAVDQWLPRIQGATLTGAGLSKVGNRIADGLVADHSYWYPDAGHLGVLASVKAKAGHATDPWELKPHYIRRSAAEEKADR